MIKKSIIALVMISLLFISIPLMAQESEQNNEVAAVVNGQNITENQLEQYAGIQQLVMTLFQSNQQFASVLLDSEEGEALINEFKKRKLDGLIEQTLLEQEAEARNVIVSQEDKEESFNQHLNQIKQQYNLSESQLVETLSQQGIGSLDQYKEMFLNESEQDLLINKLSQEVVEEAEVSDQEIENYYNENKERYEQEDQVEASHILLDTEEEAEDIIEQLENGADFSDLAEEYSTDQGSASQGGSLGFFEKNGQMIPEFEEAAFDLEIGEISNPVESQYGYHVIKVTDKKEAGVQSLTEVKDNIEQNLLNSKQQQVWEEYVEEIKDEAEIEIKF
ncbi:MAG: peptidylprolyl isomerase [Halanaerobiaceae bacterium]